MVLADTSGRSGSTARERVGILGGTFDPVHLAHVVAAQEARAALGLHRVLLVVAGDPWQKSGQVHAPAHLRLAMVEAAVAGLEGMEASAMEIERGGPTYTADTLTALSAPDRDLFLVVGADVAARLDTWVRVEEVRDRATIVVVERAGERVVEPPGDGWRVEHVVIPRLEVSSTEIRRRVAEGDQIDLLVPAGAVRIIRDRGLYTRSDDAGS